MPIMLVKKMKDEMVATRGKMKLQALKKTIVKKDKMPEKDGKKTKKENMEGKAIKKAKVKNIKGEEGAPRTFTPLAPKQGEVEPELPKDASPLSMSIVDVGDGCNYAVASHYGVPSGKDNDDIVGIDEGRNDDDCGQGSCSNKKTNLKRNKNTCKHWRKPVKARSLKSLLE
jgi:hypothetical protein